MNSTDVLVGAGVGVAIGLMLDPRRGARRGARVRNTMIRTSYRRSRALDRTGDMRLIERVRTRIAPASSHPEAIDVDASDGEITLVGSVLADEINEVLRLAATVRGVRSVVNELDSHDTADIPVLQDNERAVAIDRRRRQWAPATSAALVGMAALATGAAVMAYSVRRPRAA